MKKPNKLYEVRAENVHGRSPVNGHFWVLAMSLSDAKTKTNRWLKDHSYRGYKLTKIEDHGTIDIF